MIDKYVYAVTRNLPEKNRKEIEIELKALIEEMVDEESEYSSQEEKVESALRKLGNPKELANRYRGKERYLIGPEYFEKYLFVMKIVRLSIFIGVSLAVGLGLFVSAESIAEVIGTYFSTLFSAVLQGAAWVTGIFAFLEYNEVSLGGNKIWELSDLQEVPNKKNKIPKGDSVFSIIFITIFCSLLFFTSDIIGIYYKTGNEWDFIRVFKYRK
jgi:hypothetical protein